MFDRQHVGLVLRVLPNANPSTIVFGLQCNIGYRIANTDEVLTDFGLFDHLHLAAGLETDFVTPLFLIVSDRQVLVEK